MKRTQLIFWIMLATCCLLSITYFLTGCAPNRAKALQIKGSDTMVNLGQAWAEEFMKKNPDISVAVTGGGSGTGIAALLNKTTDIAESSRDIHADEVEIAKQKGMNIKEIHVGNDGIVAAVHPSNPISKLTIPQLSAIYTGKILNWKELGGQDQNIVVLSRERNSGTHVYFLEEVVKLGDKNNPNEFSKEILMMPSSQAIIDELSNNNAAIGYFGHGYLTGKQKALLIAKDDKSLYIEPTIESVIKKAYPIARPLYFYVNGEPVENIKKFIDFILSDDGQKIVLKMDFVPIK
jgi:phosphate transport system substrate-binding protein